jgi:cullin 1
LALQYHINKTMANSNAKIIPLEDGWNNEIKAKAIDKLEELLNGDLKSGNMFGPKEYVQIYT